MTWHPVRVRPVTEDDLTALLELAEELREQLLPGEAAGRGRPTPAGRSALEQRYRDAIADPDRHLVLAVQGPDDAEQVLGMALLSVAPTNALLDVPAVHVTHAVVAGRHRRRGAGKALVAGALAFAEERGIDQLVVSVHPGSRDAARFFARLGFAPLAVRRTAPVAVVRRRLAAGERVVEPLSRRHLVRPPAVGARATRVRRADAGGS
ncbi:MAG TPA: GNAT family N-acetyltransferase [Mycobacteriales bacterium]|nr:GNAT family N-acetyltransferase [Mycobacteriales bacterium]